MKLIDKDAIVAEIRRRLHPVVVPHRTNYDDWDEGADSERLNILSFIDTLEVKEVDLETNNTIGSGIDDSDICCNCTSCSVHTNCKYFNPEKESNVKHCFGGVPMQLKQRKESVVKEVDLESEMDKYFETMEVLEHENIFEVTFLAR